MTDNSGDRWDFLQDRIQCCLSTQNYVSQISAGFHQSLVIVTRINIALRNLLASDELRCTNLLETSCIYPSVYGPQLKFSDPQVEGVECLVRALEYWAHLRYRYENAPLFSFAIADSHQVSKVDKDCARISSPTTSRSCLRPPSKGVN